MDVRDAASVAAFAQTVADQHGGVDILVNNAGGVFHSAFLDISAKGEATLVAENFTSVTLMIRAFVPMMRGGGSIINVTSVEAFRAAPGFGIYAAMKAAVENLSKTLALEFAPHGIRVNTLAPDAIPTPGDEAMSEAVTGGDSFRTKRRCRWDSGPQTISPGLRCSWPARCRGSLPGPPCMSTVAAPPRPVGSSGRTGRTPPDAWRLPGPDL